MARLATSRRSYNPEALSQIAVIVNEVCKELAKEGTHDPYLSATAGRTLVARKVFQLAQSQWSPIQIKQLLCESCATRYHCGGERSAVRRRKFKEVAPLNPQIQSSRRHFPESVGLQATFGRRAGE